MTVSVCDQCGTRTPHLTEDTVHGQLCNACNYRQETYDNGDDL